MKSCKAAVVTNSATTIVVEWTSAFRRRSDVAHHISRQHGDDGLDALLTLVLVRANGGAQGEDIKGFLSAISDMTGSQKFIVHNKLGSTPPTPIMTILREEDDLDEMARDIAKTLSPQ